MKLGHWVTDSTTLAGSGQGSVTVNFTVHKRIHTGEKSFRCDVWGQVGSRASVTDPVSDPFFICCWFWWEPWVNTSPC